MLGCKIDFLIVGATASVEAKILQMVDAKGLSKTTQSTIPSKAPTRHTKSSFSYPPMPLFIAIAKMKNVTMAETTGSHKEFVAPLAAWLAIFTEFSTKYKNHDTLCGLVLPFKISLMYGMSAIKNIRPLSIPKNASMTISYQRKRLLYERSLSISVLVQHTRAG